MLQGDSYKYWKRLHSLSQIPEILSLIAAQLEKEVNQASSCVAKDIEKNGLIPRFLMIDCLFSSSSPPFLYFRELIKGYPTTYQRNDLFDLKSNLFSKFQQFESLFYRFNQKNDGPRG